MEFVEQAVFTSAETDRQTGYQLAGAGRNLAEEDARALSVWGPSHDALAPHAERASVNFHPLPSGAYAVSRTCLNGWEYSARGGGRVYTQYLVVHPGVLRKFANNPFALLTAAVASESLRFYDRVPPVLEPLRLLGRAADLDLSGLERALYRFGHQWFPVVTELLLTSDGPLAIAGTEKLDKWIAGLIQLIPPPWRPLLSFTTALRFSVHRPFRLLTVQPQSSEAHALQRRYAATVVDLTQPPPETPLTHPWSVFLQRFLSNPRLITLKTLYRRLRAETECDAGRFHQWAEEVLAEWEADHPHTERTGRYGGGGGRGTDDFGPPDSFLPAGRRDDHGHSRAPGKRPPPSDPISDEEPYPPEDGASPTPEDEPESPQANLTRLGTPASGRPRLRVIDESYFGDEHADAHTRRPSAQLADAGCEASGAPPVSDLALNVYVSSEGSLALAPTADDAPAPRPQRVVDPQLVSDKLRHLDHLVANAMQGDTESLRELANTWAQLRHDLEWEALAEPCSRYLRSAAHIWQQALADQRKPLEPAVTHALDVLDILFGSSH